MPYTYADQSIPFRYAWHSMSRRWHVLLACACIGFALTGCAAQMAYRDGTDLVVQGKAEEGLAKLQEAMEKAPKNTEYKAAYVHTRNRVVSDYVAQATRFAGTGRHADSRNLYQRALAIDPDNGQVKFALNALETDERHARLLTEAQAAWSKNDVNGTRQKLRTILDENPSHAGALALKRRTEQDAAAPIKESALSVAYRKPITIEFKDVALKQIFEVISRTSGLNFVFDKDVKTDQKTSIFLKNSTIESALELTLLTNQLEQQVLNGNSILIYPKTAAKQKDYQEMIVKTFFLTNADTRTVANTLKTILKSRDIVTDEKLNMLILRDSAEAVKLAEKLVALHDVAEPEVMLEVEILEVKRARLMELGVKWPDRLTLTPLPAASASGVLTLRDLANLNDARIAAGISPMTVNARKQDSDANILANPRIRARNHEKAKILIGERVPNITTTATSTGFISESISYIDVGLKLDVEPTIYLDNDVAIKVSLEVSNIVSQLQTKSGSVAYQIGTRTASTVLRLKDGENQVLAGLINDEDRRSASKVPGVGEIPIVGRLFGSTADDNQKTEIVLSITPRLVRNIRWPEAALGEFRSGTDSSLRGLSDAARTGSAPAPTASGSRPAQAQVSSPVPANSRKAAEAVAGGMAGAGTLQPEQGGYAVNGTTDRSMMSVSAQLAWEGPQQVKVGDAFSVQLVMQSEEPVTGLPLAISFNGQVLQVVDVVEGDFLKQGGAQTNFSSRTNPDGQILLTSTRSGEGGATSSGVIATVSFRAVAPTDSSPVQLVTIKPVGVEGRAVSAPLPVPYAVQIRP